MSPRLHPDFLKIPLAHRGLHNNADNRPENSRTGVLAAINAGYGIEIDLQSSADNIPIVFHDKYLGRLTGREGLIADYRHKEIRSIPLKGGCETIPDFSEILALIDGQVPLLVEIKDRDGELRPNEGLYEKDVCDLVNGYKGPIALMSFNPHTVANFSRYSPDIARGLVSEVFTKFTWPRLSAERRKVLSEIPDYESTTCSFISHSKNDLGHRAVTRVKNLGADVLCWTIRSQKEEEQARRVAQNITFEKYLAPL